MAMQLWTLGLVKEEHRTYEEFFRDNSYGKPSPAHPDFNHIATNESFCAKGLPNPSWAHEEHRRRAPSVPRRLHDGGLCAKNEYKTHDKGEVNAFVASLRACAKTQNLQRGTRVHDDILRRGLLVQCSDALVTMYAKCGALVQAEELLYMHKSRNVIPWTALITGYARQGQGHNALTCFEQMRREGLSPDAVTFACVLKACGIIGAANKGEQIHEEISRQGLLGNDVILGNALVDMYAKCGNLAKAHEVLKELPSRNVISWNALITGYAQCGRSVQALRCFEEMRCEGLSPNAVTFSSILKACGTIGAIDRGEQLHDEISRQGLLGDNVVLGTALVDMYAKCGALAKARQVLEKLPSRNVVSWSALIARYAEEGQGEQALGCFEQMLHEGVSPDAVTFASTLKVCGSMRAADKGEQIHDEIIKQGMLGNDTVLATALVDMYAKCGALAKARQVLEELHSMEIVPWNALIAGYVQEGQGEQALNCFEWMQQKGLSPDAVTFACVLKACGSIGAADKGEQIHDGIIKQGLLGNDIVLGTALMDMYAKCGDLVKARRLLEELSSRDVVSWNALIAGYAQQDQGGAALNCFRQMQCEGLSPNAVTFACVLKACGSIGAADDGERIHDEISRQGLLGSDNVLGTALVDMYAKCGAIAKARCVLEDLPSPDVTSWNALIAGYAKQGQDEQALNCFEWMQHKRIFPDTVTFACLLNACSHLGLVEDGHRYFVSMSAKYGLKPEVEHYTCMVDLYGRAGHLDKAVGVIQEMQSSDFSAVWSALLSACQKWGDVNVGRWAFEQAVQVDRSDTAPYILMGNIYAAAGMEKDAENIKAMRLEIKA